MLVVFQVFVDDFGYVFLESRKDGEMNDENDEWPYSLCCYTKSKVKIWGFGRNIHLSKWRK